MQLERTVIIPTTNADLAVQLFKNVIYNEDVLVLVVLGEDADSTTAVQYADKRAKAVVQGFERKVCWVRNVSTVENEVRKLKPGSADIAHENLSNVLAFSVTLDNKVAAVLHRGDEISYAAMEKAFLKAGIL
jgi:aminoglycoside N3'-acetyltransferase